MPVARGGLLTLDWPLGVQYPEIPAIRCARVAGGAVAVVCYSMGRGVHRAAALDVASYLSHTHIYAVVLPWLWLRGYTCVGCVCVPAREHVCARVMAVCVSLSCSRAVVQRAACSGARVSQVCECEWAVWRRGVADRGRSWFVVVVGWWVVGGWSVIHEKQNDARDTGSG